MKVNEETKKMVKSEFDASIEHQYALCNQDGVLYSSNAYVREKKSINSVVRCPFFFFFIDCFFKIGNDCFACGMEAMTTGHPFIETTINGNKIRLEIQHIHEVMLVKRRIINTNIFIEKLFVIELENKIFCIELKNKYAF